MSGSRVALVTGDASATGIGAACARGIDVAVDRVVLARRLAPGMVRRGWGRIVTITSDTFDRPPAPGLLAYITSKGALVGMTRALALELGPSGVTVNAISPGLTRTGAAIITGQTISADAGLVLR